MTDLETVRALRERLGTFGVTLEERIVTSALVLEQGCHALGDGWIITGLLRGNRICLYRLLSTAIRPVDEMLGILPDSILLGCLGSAENARKHVARMGINTVDGRELTSDGNATAATPTPQDWLKVCIAAHGWEAVLRLSPAEALFERATLLAPLDAASLLVSNLRTVLLQDEPWKAYIGPAGSKVHEMYLFDQRAADQKHEIKWTESLMARIRHLDWLPMLPTLYQSAVEEAVVLQEFVTSTGVTRRSADLAGQTYGGVNTRLAIQRAITIPLNAEVGRRFQDAIRWQPRFCGDINRGRTGHNRPPRHLSIVSNATKPPRDLIEETRRQDTLYLELPRDTSRDLIVVGALPGRAVRFGAVNIAYSGKDLVFRPIDLPAIIEGRDANGRLLAITRRG